ncbi:MAG TPA: S8 family serine peptidase [Candidatus Sulfotelmatobacter sp.]
MKRLVLGGILFLSSTFTLAERHPKLSPELKSAQRNDAMVDVIVQFNHKPQNHSAAMSAKIAGKGGSIQHDFSFFHAMHASMPASRLAELENDGEVAYISVNRPLRNKLYNAAGAVNANYAWTLGLDGTGIGVAVIDSGIHVSPDLQTSTTKKGNSQVVASYDFIGGGTDDKYGHGTHVAGIIASNAIDSTCSICTQQFRGMAPGVSLINFHVLDQNGQGSDAAVINAISQAIAVKKQYNIRVINLSLGRPVYESYLQDPLCQAVEAAWKAGIVVVVAAGNDGRDNSAGTSHSAPLHSTSG